MAVRELAETVILQSIEDLWDKDQRDLCGQFFCGRGFPFWADAAGMTIGDRRKMLSMILDLFTVSKSLTKEDSWDIQMSH